MTVVVGYTPGTNALHVVRAAAKEARLRGLPLLIVNSATGASYADRGLATTDELRDIKEQIDAPDLQIQVKQITDAASAEETIIQEATHSHAELVVIGLRHRSRTGKFLMGSTAQSVLLRAPCDVLAIRLEQP